MEKIRVLVVDDSLVIRRALQEYFRADTEIEIVGVAETGKRALLQIKALNPDVITLDIEMPELDGLETLKTLRAEGSTLPIIMFSVHTPYDAKKTLEAIRLGANDIVAKPGWQGGTGSSWEVAQRQLASRIRAQGRKAKKNKNEAPSSHSSRIHEPPVKQTHISTRVDAIGIAISTGGPSSLVKIVAQLSPTLRVPIFITQHMPPMFTKLLAERLSALGTVPACEAEDGMPIQPGRIYMAPGGYHLNLARQANQVEARLSQEPPENGCRPSADVMFRSLAPIYRSRLLAFVMTGMGCDGWRGCEQVKAHGGLVIVQDEASSCVWGMPRAVIAAKLHDAVVPLSHVADIINESCSRQTNETK